MDQNPNPPTQEENEYRKATKAVVDDTMRTDVLGPNVHRILEDYKPVNDLIQTIVKDAIHNNTEVKDAVNEVVDSNEARKRNKIFLAVGSALAGIAITVVGGLILHALTK